MAKVRKQRNFTAGMWMWMWVHSLKLTASLHMKMDGWNTTFLLGRPIFRGMLVLGGVTCFLLVDFRIFIWPVLLRKLFGARCGIMHFFIA